MKMRILAFCLAGLAAAIAWQTAAGQHHLKHSHTRPACEPGFKIVEEVVMQDVERFVCKMVPDTKKKWVYSMIDDPFCVHDTKHGQCPQCSGPNCRKLLVKRQVDVPCTTMKCVTEKIVERVPVTVYRKAPCAPKEGEKIQTPPAPVGTK